jgi:predicted transcriptional regulator
MGARLVRYLNLEKSNSSKNYRTYQHEMTEQQYRKKWTSSQKQWNRMTMYEELNNNTRGMKQQHKKGWMTT